MFFCEQLDQTVGTLQVELGLAKPKQPLGQPGRIEPVLVVQLESDCELANENK